MNVNSRLLKTKGNKITSRFGMRTITYTSGAAKGQTVTSNHNGIDIVGTGSTLDYIVAHTGGTVQSAGFDNSCGYYVNIQTAPNVVMVYYHMSAGSVTVKKGDKVKQGQVLGYMGATGNVTGAHLHFGIKVNGSWIDPEPFINADYKTTGGNGKVNEAENEEMKYYKTINDVPAAYRPTIQKLVADGSLKGTAANVLNVSEDFCRIMTVLDRKGLLGK